METKPSTARVALKWGIISGIITGIFSIGYQVLNLMPEDPLQANVGWGLLVNLLQIIFTIAVLFLAIKEYRMMNEGYLSFGEGVGISALTGAVWGVVSGGITLIYTQFIDNSAQQRMLSGLRNSYEEKGMTDEQVDSAMNMVEMMTQPSFGFVMTILMGVIIGTLLGLIVSAIMKKDRSIFS
ncbi:MAG: DUF4199 domain-containing protein [Siphonobacter sp.]